MREIDEECGIQVELGRLIQVRNNLSSSIVIFCFRATYISGELRPSEETPEVRWASSETALELIAHPILRLSLLDLLRDRRRRIGSGVHGPDPFRLVESRTF